MLFLILIAVCVVLILIRFRINSNYWKKKNITQAEDVLWTFLFEKRSLPEVCKSIYDKYYDLPYIGTTQATTPMLIIKNVEDIQSVFAGNFQSFYKRGINSNPDEILTQNLLFQEDFKKWKIIRQKLTPVFTSSKLKNMFYIIEKCARDFVKFVDNNKKQMQASPFRVLYTYTTASIGAAVFGIDTKSSTTMDSPFMDMSWTAVEPKLKTNLSLILSDLWPSLFNFLQLKFFGDQEEFFVGAVKNVLKNRRHDTVNKRHDFIEITLELQKQGVMHDPTTNYDLELTDELIAAQAFFFFLAGTDTTANTMHFTLLELAGNPKILMKLHDEIDSIITPGKEELTYTDLEKLQYLDMVISEAMRKYPPIGVITRLCTKEAVLPCGVTIEKGTIVAVPVLALHRDEKIFPNPDVFDPERFRPDNNINKYTYLPFGEGNRICIGLRFARLQVKAGLAWLLRHYTLDEQIYKPKFEMSTFGLRDSTARYNLVAREI